MEIHANPKAESHDIMFIKVIEHFQYNQVAVCEEGVALESTTEGSDSRKEKMTPFFPRTAESGSYMDDLSKSTV